jgi:hypothetical protein
MKLSQTVPLCNVGEGERSCVPRYAQRASRQGRWITWRYVHAPDAEHLSIKPLPVGSHVEAWPRWEVPCDHEYVLSIAQLVLDVGSSVEGPGGYLERMASDATIRANCERALETIYDPTQA